MYNKVSLYSEVEIAITRIFHELLSRDHEVGRATWQPSRVVGSEAYLNGTLQGPTPENARLPARLRPLGDYAPEGRAYSSERRTAISVVAVTPGREFMKYPG
jgi:hypothetical protein